MQRNLETVLKPSDAKAGGEDFGRFGCNIYQRETQRRRSRRGSQRGGASDRINRAPSKIRAANVSLPSPQRGEGRKVTASPLFKNLTQALRYFTAAFNGKSKVVC